jgi:MtN3 and saliva related transmembrane protein
MIWTEVLGYIAAFLTTVSFIPQAYRIYQTKDTQAISLSMFLIFNLGLVCWLIFGMIINSMPIIVANSITLVLAMYILLVKIKNSLDKK